MMNDKIIERKVGLFLTTILLLTLISSIFVAYKKGIFEEYFFVTIASKSGDAISKQMPVVFSGFEIGRVSSIELSDNAEVIIKAKISSKHIKWVNNSSEFILEKPLIGTTKIVVKTPTLQASELDPHTIKNLKVVDGIDEVIAKVTPVVEKAEIVVANIEKITTELAEKESLIAMVTGNNKSGNDLTKTMESAHRITLSIEKMLNNIDGSIYGENGVIADIKELTYKINQILTNVEEISKNATDPADNILQNIEKITADIAEMSGDLNRTKDEIDLALKNTNDLLIEVENLVPFKDKKEVKLP